MGRCPPISSPARGSTFYAHFVDEDDLLMAILADLEMPGLDPGL